MATTTSRHPGWWQSDYDSGWDRIKEAFRRDWEQTKHDMHVGGEPDLNQNVDDTVKQMAGKQPIPPADQPNWDMYEPAYRFGYGARMHYGSSYSNWDDRLENQLRSDWSSAYGGTDEDWSRFRGHIRRGWDYSADARQARAA